MSHTPKPKCPICIRIIPVDCGETLDEAVEISRRVEGCTGLNPAAFREVVEALKLAKPIAETLMSELSGRKATDWELVNDGLIQISKALAHAEQP